MRPTDFLKAVLVMVSMATGGLATRDARAQTIIYVNAAAAANGNGITWSSAYNTLEPGLARARTVAQGGQLVEVWIAAGKYHPESVPGDPRGSTFNVIARMSLVGGFAGTESSRSDRDLSSHVTILSGDMNGDDGPNFANTADNARRVVSADTIDNGSLIVELDGLVIEGGNADGGTAAMHASGSALHVFDCIFRSNQAAGPNAGVSAGVGGIGGTRFLRCAFLDNRCGAQSGGGPEFDDSGCAFSGSGYFFSCLFARNSGTACGGAVSVIKSQFDYCTFAGNSSGTYGGAVRVYPGSPNFYGTSFLSCILQGNTAALGGSQIDVYFSTNADLSFCSIEGGCSGIGLRGSATRICSNSVPAVTFVNAAAGDYHQAASSAGIDVSGTAPAYFSDLDRNSRQADGPDPDLLKQPDIGCYEYGSTPFLPILFVKTAQSGLGDGSSWNDAMVGIPAAIGQAVASGGQITQVWVAAGTYKPAGPAGSRSASFQLQNGVSVHGGFGGTENALAQRNIAANPTILSGDLNGDDNGGINRGDNSYHLIIADSLASTALLDGFTISGAYSSVNSGGTFDGCGALAVRGGAPAFANCTFTDNYGTRGGAVTVFNGATPTFLNCSFISNRATWSVNGDLTTRGGAVYSTASSPRFNGCTFDSNVGDHHGGAVATENGGTPVFQRCTFSRNQCGPGGGGAISNYTGVTTLTLVNCSLYGNNGYAGSAIENWAGGQLSMFGCLVAANIGQSCAIYNGDGLPISQATLTNCTIAGNIAVGAAAGILSESATGAPVTLTNCIVSGNVSGDTPGQAGQVAPAFGGGGPFTINYSTIQGWNGSFGGVGNNGSDPVFLRIPQPAVSDFGDLHVGFNSPAIDSGNSLAIPADGFDINGNGSTTEALPLDLDGNPRFYDYPPVANTGNGTPPVDRGCYEFRPPDTSVPGDRRWIAPAGGVFNSLFNWFPGVPGTADNAVFDIAATYAVTMPGAAVSNQQATIRNGDVTLALAGQTYSLTSGVDPSLVIGDTPNEPATLEISGGRVNAVECRIGSTSGSVGTVKLQGSGNASTPSVTLASTEGLCVGCQGTGTLSITGGARVSCLYGFLGEQSGATGHVNINGPGSRLDAPFFLAIDNGNVNVSNGGTLATGTFGAIYLFPNGSISGDGTVSGHVVNFGGIAPGNSPGTLTINGNYDQVGTLDNLGDVSGKLNAQASGAGNGQFDKLVVNGAATLGGGLSLSLLNNYVPAPADQLQVISATGGLTKPFDVVFFPALDNTAASSKYFRTAYSGLRGPGAGSVTINLGNLATSPSFNTPSQYTLDNPPNSVAVGDLNGDGLPDVAITIPDAADPTGTTGVVVVLINQGGVGQNWQGFAPHLPGNPTTIPPIPVGLNPTAAAITKLDASSGAANHLIVANTASNSLSLLKFVSGALQTVATQATDPEPLGLAATDFSGLGGPSTIVVVACGGGAAATTGSITMLGNTTAGGTVSFIRRNVPGPQGHKPVNPRPFNPDQDKDIDLAVAMKATDGGADVVVVYVNGLNPGAAVPVPDLFNTLGAAAMLPVGSGPVQTLAGKLSPITATNPAGKKEDLITVNNTGNSISVVINTNLTQDAPTFAPAVEYSFDVTGATSSPVAPRSAVIADLDQTGTLDVAVVANNPSGTNRVVKLLRNDSTTNLGVTQVAFAQMPDLASGSKPVAIVSADLDGDGQTDLVTINSTSGRDTPNTVQVVRNALGSPATSVGACCNGANCVVEPALQCVGTAQRFAGLGTACNAPGNFAVPCCRGDFDQNGSLALADIFSFLNAWFAGDHRSDTDDNGNLAIADIFTFLNAWFAGC